MTRKLPEHAITTTVRVGLHHCDPLAVAWHGRYFEWFEAARTELFRSVDLAVPQIRDLGYKMFIVEGNCRYMAPIAYDDVVEIRAWFVGLAPLIRVTYDIYNPANERWCARALTVLATTKISGDLLAATPDAILDRLPRLLGPGTQPPD